MSTTTDELILAASDAPDISLPIAGPGARSYAFIIDWHIRLILAIAWMILSGFVIGIIASTAIKDLFGTGAPASVGLFVLVPAMIIYFLYHPVIEIMMRGRTPGKRMTGIRIVDANGQVPSAGPLLVRNIFRLLDSMPTLYVVGLVSVLMTQRQVRIGDLAAGTMLVYERRPEVKAIESAIASEQSELGADLEMLEIARDLFARWNTLARPVRIRLARQLLRKAHQEVPQSGTEREQDKALKTTLQSLLAT